MAIHVTIDGISPATRHFLIGAAAAALSYALPYAEADYTNWNLPPALTAVVGGLLPFLVMWSTSLTKQYGYQGKAPSDKKVNVGSASA